MSLISILISLGVQRYAKFNSYSRQIDWLVPYVKWMQSKIKQITKGHGLVGVLILVLPILIAVSIVFSVTYHLLGLVGYVLLSIVLLWYCLDGRDLRQEPYETKNVSKLFTLTYEGLFGVIFWFFIFGPVGLTLYYMIVNLRLLLEKQKSDANKDLMAFAIKTQGVLDWVPLRLLGLSYALVGNFSATFKAWMPELLTGIKASHEQAAKWGLEAITHSEKKKSKQSADESTSNQMDDAITLIDRALLVWLVVMALLSIGSLLG